MVCKWSIHNCLGVWSPTRAVFVVNRLFWSHSWKFIRLGRCGEVFTLTGMSQLGVMVLDSGWFTLYRGPYFPWCMPQKKVTTIDFRLETDEFFRILLQCGWQWKTRQCTQEDYAIWGLEVAQRRQGDEQQNIMLHRGPPVVTRGFCVKEAVEGRDLCEDKFHSTRGLQGVAVQYASLCLGFQPRITCVEFLVYERNGHCRKH